MSEYPLTRRDALRAGFTAGVILPSVATPVSADDGLTAANTATFDVNGVPEIMRVAEDTAISIEWGDIPPEETITVIFDVRPSTENSQWETLDEYSFTPNGSNNSRTVTHDELFADNGDLTQHSQISLDDLAITPTVEPPCKARTYNARVEVTTDSLGAVGYLTDSFQVLNILDTGLGYNLGANFGLRHPDFSRESHVDFDGERSEFAIQADSYSAGVEAMNELLEQGAGS